MHWLRRHWRGITGAALLVWQGIDWLLKWGEHVKFITEETQHLGEARKVIDFLANPPWWGPPAAIVCGLLLIWWDLKRRSAEQPAVVPAIVPSPPYTPVSNEPDPDMPIRDLFFFI